MVEGQAAQDVVGVIECGRIRPKKLVDICDEIVMREHYALRQSGGAAGVGKCSKRLIGGLIWLWKGSTGPVEQIGERFCACYRLTSRINPAQIGQSGQVDACDVSAVGDQANRAGILQLIAHLAFAISGVEQSGYRSGQLDGVERSAEFPRVVKENADHMAGTYASPN